MRLFAAIVPPRWAAEALAEVVTLVRAPEERVEKRRRLRLPGRAIAPAGPNADVIDRELARPPVDKMHIPITSFGNVTLGDSIRLADALRAQVATWPSAEVFFAGAKALEFPGDESVWAVVEGQTDRMREVGRGVPQVVARLGFFVDRRQFRPWLSVGTITDDTTAPFLEQVVAAVDAFRGEPWILDAVHLMRRAPDADGPHDFESMERMPLAQG